MTAELNQTHGFLEPLSLDALANMLFRDELLGGFGIDLGKHHSVIADC